MDLAKDTLAAKTLTTSGGGLLSVIDILHVIRKRQIDIENFCIFGGSCHHGKVL
jgi:hypothetical protein